MIATHGLLAGFTPLVWLVAALTAGGGLLVAAVVKYADNVLKTYATAVSIVLTCIFGTVATRVPPSPGFLNGMFLVLLSMLIYNDVETALYKKPLAWLVRARRLGKVKVASMGAAPGGAAEAGDADAGALSMEQLDAASADAPL